MSQTNRISQSLTTEQLDSIADGIKTIQSTLKDSLAFNLTAEERIRMLKMGDKTLAFVSKAVDYAKQNPNLLPAYLSIEEMEKDYKLSRDLYNIYEQLNTLTRSVEDSLMVAGSEAYDGSLIFYHAVRGASRAEIAGAQAVYDDLKKRFPRRTPEQPDAPENP